MSSLFPGPAAASELWTGPELSIVVPAYNEEANLVRLYEELLAVLDDLALSWEIVVADDGSSDSTWQTVIRLHERDARVKGVRLSRNFGHQYALLAGMMHAGGRAVVTMDADLQHPPRVIRELVREWQQGSQVVHTVRRDAESTPFLKRLGARLFYKVYSWLSGVPLQHGMADFRLLDRSALNAMLSFPEQGLFLRGLVQWVGFPSSQVSFTAEPRFSGRTKYTPRKMLKFAWWGISSFSVVPLRLATLCGFLTGIAALLQLGYVLWVRLFTDAAVPGWASAVGIVLLMFGILFILLGIIGEYIGRILIEVKQRPRYLVRENVGIEESCRAEVALGPAASRPASPVLPVDRG